MPAKSKLFVGLLVVSAGLATALCFRKDHAAIADSSSQRRAAPQDQPQLRRLGGPPAETAFATDRSVDEPTAKPRASASLANSISAQGSRSASDAIRSAERGVDEPRGVLLKPIGIHDLSPPADRLNADSDDGSSAERDARPITHVIADGDTLARLAERYFGSDCQQRILFELNRDILTSPDILPIGKSLKIPPRSSALHAAQSPPADVETPPPLVPLR